MAEQQSGILRHWPWRLLLLLALIPLAFAAVQLAQLASSSGDISDDGEHVLTARSLNRQGEFGYRVLSLWTGQSAEFRGSNAIFSDQAVLWTERDVADVAISKQLDLATFRESELARIPGDELSDRFFSPAPGVYAAVNEQNELVAIDLRNQHRASVSLPPLAPPNRYNLLLMGSPSRLIVAEYSSTATTRQMLLFSYENGELAKLAQWTIGSPPAYSLLGCVAGDVVFSANAQSVLEIRRLSDGTLIDSQSLGVKLKVPPGTVIGLQQPKAGLVPLHVTPSRKIIYDYVGQRVVAERFLPNSRRTEVSQEATLFVESQSIEVVRLSDSQTVRRIDFSQYIQDAAFTDDGRQMIVLLSDESVRQYDVATGTLLLTSRSRAWVLPTVIALLGGYVLWAWLWAWLGLCAGWHPLADMVVLHGLVLIGLLLPVLWVGSLFAGSVVSFFDVESLAACWLLLLSLWFIFGHARWSLRLLGPILGVAAAIGLNFLVFAGRVEGIALPVVGIAGIAVFFATLFGLARRWGWRLVGECQADRLSFDAARTHQMPLRDLFWLMATIAVLFAVVRFVPVVRIDSKSLYMLIVIVASLTATALGATWSVLGSRSWLFGFVCLIVLVVGICVINAHFFQRGLSWMEWLACVRLYSPLAIFAFGSLLIFRVRGWRLVWPRVG